MKTSLRKISSLELSKFDHMSTSTIWFALQDKMFLMSPDRSHVVIMIISKYLLLNKAWSSQSCWHHQNCNHIYQNKLLRLRKVEGIRNYMLKDTLSGLTQFLATENRLKMMKNAFDLTLKALFVLQYLFWTIGHVVKRLNKKA